MQVCSDRERGVHPVAVAVSAWKSVIFFSLFPGTRVRQAQPNFTIGKKAWCRQGAGVPGMASVGCHAGPLR